jgi:isopentenyldiphosphate isomerase
LEIWDVLDENGNKTGKTILRGEELKESEYHLEAHLWVINSMGDFLIQKRSKNLKNAPGIWAITGGCITQGEDSITGLKREVKEELGLDIDENKLSFHIRHKRKNALADIYILYDDVNIDVLVLQKEEVEEVKWVSLNQLKNMLSEGTFFKYNNDYLELIFNALKNFKGNND